LFLYLFNQGVANVLTERRNLLIVH
jgi:hypothetical protein